MQILAVFVPLESDFVAKRGLKDQIEKNFEFEFTEKPEMIDRESYEGGGDVALLILIEAIFMVMLEVGRKTEI